MSLSNKKLALKKFNREARRKKIRKLHEKENKRIAAGDYRVMGEIRKRRLKNRRNHHRKMEGENKRNFRIEDMEV